MLSVIICSVRPALLQQLRLNIGQTVGVEHEIIAIDNREKQWPIAKAYNEGARQAKYPYLLFVHEDVKLHRCGWGEEIEEKLKEPDCGAIGVAGTRYKSALYSGWYQYEPWVVSYHMQQFATGTKMMICHISKEEHYKEVVALDGMALFVRKEVWKALPFDEKELTGFHCYDLDFTLQLRQKGYKNYVCASPRFVLEHFSLGHYSDDWFTTTIRLHDGKWKPWLPMVAETSAPPSPTELKKAEEKIAYSFLFRILRSHCAEKKRILAAFWKRPVTWKHLMHSLSCTLKYGRTLLKHEP